MVDPLCRSHDRHPSPDGALRDAEQKKMGTYGDAWNKSHADRPLVPFAISTYGQLGPSAAGLLAHLKDRAQKHRTYFPVRWYMSAIACTAIRGSAFVRDAWLKAFSKGLCAHASSFLRGASAETAEQWHSDEVGDGIVEPSQPCSVRV